MIVSGSHPSTVRTMPASMRPEMVDLRCDNCGADVIKLAKQGVAT